MVPLSHPLSMSVEWLGIERRKSDYDGGRSTDMRSVAETRAAPRGDDYRAYRTNDY